MTTPYEGTWRTYEYAALAPADVLESTGLSAEDPRATLRHMNYDKALADSMVAHLRSLGFTVTRFTRFVPAGFR